MSSHESTCIICGARTWCHNGTHALGVGESVCENPNAQSIEFCSVECFAELHRRMVKRARIVRELATDDPAEFSGLDLSKLPFWSPLPPLPSLLKRIADAKDSMEWWADLDRFLNEAVTPSPAERDVIEAAKAWAAYYPASFKLEHIFAIGPRNLLAAVRALPEEPK